MGRKEKVSIDEKLRAIGEYLSGKKGISQICFELEIHTTSFEEWLRKYRIRGLQGLQNPGTNICYPEAIKLKATTEYINGLGSLRQICSKYNISGHGILRDWIKKYNGHEESKSHNVGGNGIMTKGRKTTYEERVEIVSFCIANNDNYQMSAKRFQVSYRQVYTWTQKYKAKGYEALSDKRGKQKKLEELSESEKVDAQLKLLEVENRRLKMENDFLKKLDEVERRREKTGYAKRTCMQQ